MINETLLNVLSHEGVVAIVTCGEKGAHVVNTWNSYIVVNEDEKLLIPAAGMRRTQQNIEQNNAVKITLGSKDVMGHRSIGTGFLIEGSAKFIESGSDFDTMKEKFPFLSRVLEITILSTKQTV
ncbi:MAG: Pyridoxamine 5-phosphate oxidase [Clostridia bacterium]|jgi:flavin reductase (DIM6/NTAB) family NADH-FMN oxidoreductase RutF|nr:Pyridoxamine 5-phosphate oxidase [Clostridia bacterium]